MSGDTKAPVGEIKMPVQVGQVLEAMVATVKPFGIFVRLKGFRANGLVHLSQVCIYKAGAGVC